MPKQLTIESLKRLKPGDEIYVWYDHYNKGSFALRFYRIIEDDSYVSPRVIAEFKYPDMQDWSKPDDYFYEFEGVVCRGSGAEPLWWSGEIRRA